MRYNLIITERADELLGDCLDYLIDQLRNEQAAKHLLDGMNKVYDRLEDNPFQFPDCRDAFFNEERVQGSDCTRHGLHHYF